jgi:transposase-like protein
VSRLGLPTELRRSLACTNIIENMMGTLRRVTRNVKRWSSSSMALRWTAAAMNEAKKGFRRLKAYKQLPALRLALAAHYEKETNSRALLSKLRRPLNFIHGNDRFTKFNKARGSSGS